MPGVLLLDHVLAVPRGDAGVDLGHGAALFQDRQRRDLLDPHARVAKVGLVGDRGEGDRQAGLAERRQQLGANPDLGAEIAPQGRRGVGETVDEVDH
jgi:hypothetical protein